MLDRLIDLVFDITEPLSGTCAICAFWRGVLGGVLVTAFVVWVF